MSYPSSYNVMTNINGKIDNLETEKITSNIVNHDTLSLTDANGKLKIINAVLSPSSGANSGLHLVVNINNTNYKIRLENN